MIINFSVQNFGSIKEKQTLSFEADKSTHLEDHYIIHALGGLRLLKLALIYGANGSGKSTVLKALNFLAFLINQPVEKKSDSLDFQPFLFDPQTPHENTILAIEFIQNGVKYSYEVVFKKAAIVSEQLHFYNPNKAVVYKRTTNIEKQLTTIDFGFKIKIDKTVEKVLEANTLWNNTVLGGFLKTNMEVKELQEVNNWFRLYLWPLIYPKYDLNFWVLTLIEGGFISKQDVVNVLRKSDFNITGFTFKNDDKFDVKDFFGVARKSKESDEIDKSIRSLDNFSKYNLEVEHTVNGKIYNLPFIDESEGTKRFYGFAGLLCFLIREKVVFPIDELEASLHPELYIHFLLSFLMNAKQSQLIATTHNREILDNKDLFRNDAIWFTDKSESCATELYSLADFDTSAIRDTTNVLNAYKSGKLKGTPNLGDYYIDLSK